MHNFEEDILEIFNQLTILSSHVYAIEELLISKSIIAEPELEEKINIFIEEITSEDSFEEDTEGGPIVH